MKRYLYFFVTLILLIGGYFIYNHQQNQNSLYSWNREKNQIYEFSLKTKFIKNSEISYLLELDGNLLFRVFDINSTNVKVGFELSSLDYVSNGFKDSDYAKLLSKPFLAILNKNGNMLEFIFPNSLSNEDTILLEKVIRNFETTVQMDNLYKVKEKDYVGEYIAEYLRDFNTISRKKLDYTKDNSKNFLFNTKLKISKSLTTIKIDENKNWISEFKLEENGKIDGAFLNSNFENFAYLKITKHDSNFNSFEIFKNITFEEFVKEFQNEKKADISYHKQRELDIKKVNIKNSKVDIFDLISKLKYALDNNKNLMAIEAEIAEFLTLFPEYLEEIEKLISNRESDNLNLTLIHILELSGSDKAQKSLLKILDGTNFNHIDSVRSAIALGGIKNPTKETINKMFAIYNNTSKADTNGVEKSGSTIMALGIMSKNIEHKDNIYKFLDEKLTSTSNQSELVNTIYAISNTRNSQFVESLSKFVKSDSEDIKKVSYEALGELKSVESQNLLNSGLQNESSTIIKSAILNSVSKYNNSSESYEIIKSKVLTEESNTIKNKMIDYMSKNIENRDETIKVFNELLKQENSKDNIKLMLQTIKESK